MEPVTPVRHSGFGWLHWLPLTVVLLVWCAAIGLCIRIYTDPRWGIDARVTVTAGSLVAALLVTLVWFTLFSGVSWGLRICVLALVLTAVLVPTALFRVDQVTGYLAPTFRFRWSPRADQQLERLSESPPLASPIDLSTSTPYDFPQFLGPKRDLSVDLPELQFHFNWDERPPQLLWRQPIGAGWSAFSAVNGYAVTMEQRDDQELTTCYEVSSGRLIWANAVTTRHETTVGGVGPRSTPTIHEGRVYCLGATGVFRCLDGSNGQELWRHDLQQEFGVQDESQGIAWGRSASPLIVGSLVVVPAGGPFGGRKFSLVAYDRISGEEVWRGGTHQVSYASPTLGTFHGVDQILIVVEDYICAHDPADGTLLWEHAWPGKSTSNASCCQAVPCSADRVFVSKGYGHGCALLKVERDASGNWSAEEVWQSARVMKTKFSNVVIHEDHIYGLDDVILECLELDSGRRCWKRGRFGYGQILRVGETLLVQSESGEMSAVSIDPGRFDELARFTALDGKTWNTICLYGPYLLVRNAEEAACYELPHERSSPGAQNRPARRNALTQLRANSAMIRAH